MPEPDPYLECGYRWEVDPATLRGVHGCTKHPDHVYDITDDDHRCCCGTTSEGDVHA